MTHAIRPAAIPKPLSAVGTAATPEQAKPGDGGTKASEASFDQVLERAESELQAAQEATEPSPDSAHQAQNEDGSADIADGEATEGPPSSDATKDQNVDGANSEDAAKTELEAPVPAPVVVNEASARTGRDATAVRAVRLWPVQAALMGGESPPIAPAIVGDKNASEAPPKDEGTPAFRAGAEPISDESPLIEGSRVSQASEPPTPRAQTVHPARGKAEIEREGGGDQAVQPPVPQRDPQASGNPGDRPQVGVISIEGLSASSARSISAAANASHSGRPNEPVDAQSVTQAVARGLAAAAAQKGGSITMRLIPETLGQVRIQMDLVQGSVSVRIETSGAAAQGLLNQNLAMLRQSLESKGLAVNRISVDLAPPTGAPVALGAQRESSGGSAWSGSMDSQQHNAAGGESRGGWHDKSGGAATEIFDYDEAVTTPADFASRIRFHAVA